MQYTSETMLIRSQDSGGTGVADHDSGSFDRTGHHTPWTGRQPVSSRRDPARASPMVRYRSVSRSSPAAASHA